MADAVLKDLSFRSHVALQIAMTPMDTVHAARSGPADVSHHLGERAGIDIVEEAEDINVLWRAAMRSDQSRVVLQRCFIIADADVASVVELRDINVVFVLIGVDDAIGREACSAAMGVVNDNDVLEPEQMLRDGDRPKRVDGAAAGDDDGENGRRRRHSISGTVENDVSGKDLVAEELGDGVRYLGRPRIVAVDHEGLERNGLGKRLSRRRLIERGLSAEGIAIELTHGLAPSSQAIS